MILKSISRKFENLNLITRRLDRFSSLMTTAEGITDLTPIHHRVTWGRHKLVDFSFPTSQYKLAIMSSNVRRISPQVLFEPFDTASYILISMILAALSLTGYTFCR
jgi:hypothetical protein